MTLDARIAHHRELYRSDLLIERLVSRQPPTSLDVNTGELHQEPGAATGMPMSGRLLKYLSHPEGYGSDFPWSKSWWLLRNHCRRTHRYHRGPRHWNGSLCHSMIGFVVVREWSVENAGNILQHTDPAGILRQSFDFMDQTLTDFRRKAEQRQREEEGHGPGPIAVPVHEHRPLPGLHELECVQCRKKRDAA